MADVDLRILVASAFKPMTLRPAAISAAQMLHAYGLVMTSGSINAASARSWQLGRMLQFALRRIGISRPSAISNRPVFDIFPQRPGAFFQDVCLHLQEPPRKDTKS